MEDSWQSTNQMKERDRNERDWNPIFQEEKSILMGFRGQLTLFRTSSSIYRVWQSLPWVGWRTFLAYTKNTFNGHHSYDLRRLSVIFSCTSQL